MRLLYITYKVDEQDSLVGFAVGWINALAARLDRVHVICLVRGPAQLAANVSVHSLGKERGVGRLGRLANFYRAAWALRRDADAVFCQFSPIYVFLIAPLAKMRGWPVVLWYTHRHVSLQLRLAAALADRVATASPESLQLRTRKRRVIGHGIDVARFCPAPPGNKSPGSEYESRLKPAEAVEPAIQPGNSRVPRSAAERGFPGAAGRKVILAVGRIAPIKNYEMLIDAASLLLPMRPEAEFIVAGGVQAAGLDGYFERLKARAAERGLGERFRFVGAVPYGDMPDLYRQAIIAVNLCPTGGLDKAVIEGMAAGTPTLVRNETFRPILGESAEMLIVTDADAQAVAARLDQLLRLPEAERRSLGARLRQVVVDRFSQAALASQLSDLLAEVG